MRVSASSEKYKLTKRIFNFCAQPQTDHKTTYLCPTATKRTSQLCTSHFTHSHFCWSSLGTRLLSSACTSTPAFESEESTNNLPILHMISRTTTKRRYTVQCRWWEIHSPWGLEWTRTCKAIGVWATFGSAERKTSHSKFVHHLESNHNSNIIHKISAVILWTSHQQISFQRGHCSSKTLFIKLETT